MNNEPSFLGFIRFLLEDPPGWILLIGILAILVICINGLYKEHYHQTILKYNTVSFEKGAWEYPVTFNYQEKRIRVDLDGTTWVQEGTSEVVHK